MHLYMIAVIKSCVNTINRSHSFHPLPGNSFCLIFQPAPLSTASISAIFPTFQFVLIRIYLKRQNLRIIFLLIFIYFFGLI